MVKQALSEEETGELVASLSDDDSASEKPVRVRQQETAAPRKRATSQTRATRPAKE